MILNYKGIWDVLTNTPELSDGIGTTGDTYIVSITSSDIITTVDLGTGTRSVAAYTYLIYASGIWNCSLFVF